MASFAFFPGLVSCLFGDGFALSSVVVIFGVLPYLEPAFLEEAVTSGAGLTLERTLVVVLALVVEIVLRTGLTLGELILGVELVLVGAFGSALEVEIALESGSTLEGGFDLDVGIDLEGDTSTLETGLVF